MNKEHIKKIKKTMNFRNKKDYVFFAVFIAVSSIIIASFPVITQMYLRHIYPQKNLELLIKWTLIFFLTFTLKLLVDVKLEKFSTKYYLKMQKHIREQIYEKIKTKKRNVIKNYDLLYFKVEKYTLFIQKIVINNYQQIITLIAVTTIMAFFNFALFKYIAWFIPIFISYYFMYKHKLKKRKNALKQVKSNKQNLDLLRLLMNEKLNEEEKEFRKITNLHVQKELINRQNLTNINQSLNASINFYRLFFLAYFGYAIITTGQNIVGLIVGLLYITIFARSIIKILENLVIYEITHRAVKEIHKYLP